jgi:hypothetical protein
MPIIKQFDIYEVSGGAKVHLLTVEPKEKKELDIKEIQEAAGQILEVFYEYDKVKLFDEQGNGFVARSVNEKTYIIKTILETTNVL